MSIMMTELCDALTNAGADEARARQAATAVTRSEDQFNHLDKHMSDLTSH